MSSVDAMRSVHIGYSKLTLALLRCCSITRFGLDHDDVNAADDVPVVPVVPVAPVETVVVADGVVAVVAAVVELLKQNKKQIFYSKDEV